MTQRSHPRKRRRLWLAIAIPLVLLIAAGVWAVVAIGPLLGIYVLPVSPSRYVTLTLEKLDQGYHAQGDAWQAERARVLEATDGVSDYAVLHAELEKATKVAGGKHSFFLTPDEAAESDESGTEEFRAPTVTTADHVTTLELPEFGAPGKDLEQQYADTLASGVTDAAPQTCGWIIDLRDNRGGNMYPMLSGVASLLPNGTAMTFRSVSGATTEVTIQDDGAGLGGRTTIRIEDAAKVTDQPIAVLYNGMTASSGEAVATAFRGLPKATSFGTQTAGYTSANMVHRLPDGAMLGLTGAVYVDRNGVDLAEQPMQPDHLTTAAEAPAAALAWIREQGCAGG
ncbi:MAG: S41 family peptidase [Propionibacteriaceae bacterium]|nr:S41 family peptidase [Propionibacteriaceae bacterium]